MNSVLLLLLLFSTANAHSNPSQATATQARRDAIYAMEKINPANIIPSFTENPAEIQFRPTKGQEGAGSLVGEGSKRAQVDEAARFVIQQEGSRGKITPNPKASEIDYAERLLDNADAIIQPACHMEPVPCEEHRIEKTCEESANYSPLTCRDTLNVTIQRINHPEIKRTILKPPRKDDLTHFIIDLTSCDKSAGKGSMCAPHQEVILHSNCEHLSVQVMVAGYAWPLIKEPTCSDPTLIVDYQGSPMALATLLVTEFVHDDQWTHTDCARLSEIAMDKRCVPDSANACLDENQTRIINGVPVTRRCWGQEQNYRCADGMNSNCAPLLEDGCSNTASVCTHFTNDYCDAASKTFQCTEKICFPDKEVCPEMMGCADGSCDTTVASESNDINEGLSRLGTLAGTAEDAYVNQTYSGQASIFKGEVLECEKYMFGMRDCCTDKGFLDGLIHCPTEMQILQRAKVENRVVELGHYKHHVLGTTRYVFCVFPTKLASIVQIEGRGSQLHIPFGEAEKPDCRVITPEELEGINFQTLNLTPLVAEITSKKTLPTDASVDGVNTNRVESWYEKGVSHD